MSIVVDLPADLLAFIDEYVAAGEAPTREQSIIDAVRFTFLLQCLFSDYENGTVSSDAVFEELLKASASPEAERWEIPRRALADDEDSRFEELAAQLRALTAGRKQTPSEDLI